MRRRDFLKATLGLGALSVVPKPFARLASALALPGEAGGKDIFIRVREPGKERKEYRMAFRKEIAPWHPEACLRAINSFLRVNGVSGDYMVEVWI